MEEHNEHKKRIEELEEKLSGIQSREKQKKRAELIKISGRLGGAALASGLVYSTLEGTLRGTGEFVGEVADGFATVSRLLRQNPGNDCVSAQLENIDSGLREYYQEAHSSGYVSRISEAATAMLDVGGRASENFPGAKSKPIKELRGIKAKIFEYGRGIFGDEEEAEITGTEEYAKHYNTLKRLEDRATERLDELDGKIGDLSYTLAIEEARENSVSGEGTKVLEKLVREYNTIHTLRGQLGEVSIEDIHRGMESESYQSLIQEAGEYGIKMPDFSAYETSSVLLGVVLAGVAGAKIGKYLGSGLKAAYQVSSTIARKAKDLKKSIKK